MAPHESEISVATRERVVQLRASGLSYAYLETWHELKISCSAVYKIIKKAHGDRHSDQQIENRQSM